MGFARVIAAWSLEPRDLHILVYEDRVGLFRLHEYCGDCRGGLPTFWVHSGRSCGYVVQFVGKAL